MKGKATIYRQTNPPVLTLGPGGQSDQRRFCLLSCQLNIPAAIIQPAWSLS